MKLAAQGSSGRRTGYGSAGFKGNLALSRFLFETEIIPILKHHLSMLPCTHNRQEDR